MELGLHQAREDRDMDADDSKEEHGSVTIKKKSLFELRLLIFVVVSLMMLCCLYEDPFVLASRLLRGEFPDNDAFVAFLEFYHT
jgi:hypothetical protein